MNQKDTLISPLLPTSEIQEITVDIKKSDPVIYLWSPEKKPGDMGFRIHCQIIHR